jgi:hypothetical protein
VVTKDVCYRKLISLSELVSLSKNGNIDAFLGGRDQRIAVPRPSRQKLTRPYSKSKLDYGGVCL